GIIVACAFGIMMPGLVSYLFGLWRIFLLIAIIVITTVTLVVIYHRVLRRKADSKSVDSDGKDDVEKSAEP
ncbi:MAG TPA: hypothetical protein PKC98_17380, partial [Candidatus Melainabacteria bacterium]|nr:hypothetical protein [Candidatus Melainabacteria bacterium]